jgi:hypothetical protein
MSAVVTIRDDILEIEIKGIHKILSFKSKLEIPMKNVRNASLDVDSVAGWLKGWRFPGINIPYIITAGTFYEAGGKVFWDVCNAKKSIIIDLIDEDYSKLIIEVDNPEGVLDLIKKNLQQF